MAVAAMTAAKNWVLMELLGESDLKKLYNYRLLATGVVGGFGAGVKRGVRCAWAEEAMTISAKTPTNNADVRRV